MVLGIETLILTKAGGDHDPVPAANPQPISPENKILKRIFVILKVSLSDARRQSC